jgi:ADP-heptose:LPS heptosyltransferase/lauroyl/myristoyl acyltransferase
MITKHLIVSVGFLFSKVPYGALEVFAYLLARVYLVFPQKRKRLLFSNLTHAFPHWTADKIKKTAIKSTVCLVEMGFFSLIYPHLSRFERRSTLLYSEEIENELIKLREKNKPTLILLPHISLFESIATSQVFRPFGGKTLGAIYRPNSNPSIDGWVNKSRTDLGLKVFSRKKGLIQARNHLRNGNWLALLFDQNAGLGGELSLFLNRLCSITPLPDIVVKNINANIVLATPVRLSFFRAKLKFYNLGEIKTKSVSHLVHQKLETIINEHRDGLPEWLWSHGKWKTQDSAHQIFHLHSKRTNLPELNKIPKQTKIWIRMPNWLGDIVMAIPLIRAIYRGRPDAEITLFCQPHYQSLLEHLNIGQRVIALPPKGIGYFLFFWKLRRQYPDVHFLFTNSLRGDLEAYLCGAPLRLGGSTGRKRKLLSHQAIISKEFEEKHQTALWGEYLKFFGLKGSIDFTPLEFSKPKTNRKIICLAPGSSNTPAKRWPIHNWVNLLESLIEQLQDYEFRLIGTARDSIVCDEITNVLNSERVKNFSGKTDLVSLCSLLSQSKCLVCNDSGAMHIANSIGVPVYAVFGVTNSEITGPIFSHFKKIYNFSKSGSSGILSNLLHWIVSDQK